MTKVLILNSWNIEFLQHANSKSTLLMRVQSPIYEVNLLFQEGMIPDKSAASMSNNHL